MVEGSVKCRFCGVLSQENQQSVHKRKICIVEAIILSPTQNKCDIATHSHTTNPPQEDAEQDEPMGLTKYQQPTGQPEHTGTTDPPDLSKATGASDYEDNKIYEESEDDGGSEQGNETTEEFEAPWLTAELNKFDSKWANRWELLQSKLMKDAEDTRAELSKIREAQKKSKTYMDKFTTVTSSRFETVEANQRTILRSQNGQKTELQAVKNAVIVDIQKKLEGVMQKTSMEGINGTENSARNPNSYAHKAAQPPANKKQPPKPIPKYTAMAKRVSQTRPPTAQTNGALSRVYVKEWRREPVGVVKKALRQDIVEWIQLNAANEGQMVTGEVWPELDAVCHVNQFGTPECPMMEIACTNKKSDAVRAFLSENNIETWTVSINPFREPSIDDTDTTAGADKQIFGHFKRVLGAWWKAANFIQSSDTDLYYQRLIKQAVKGADALQKWPQHILGVNIDARGVNDTKENPNIFFDYEDGYTPPSDRIIDKKTAKTTAAITRDRWRLTQPIIETNTSRR